MMAEEVTPYGVAFSKKLTLTQNLTLTLSNFTQPSQTSPNPLLLGEGLQDFQSLEEGIYLLLIGGGGEAGGGFRRESRWGLRELGNELEGAWKCPKDEGVAVRVFFLVFQFHNCILIHDIFNLR